MKTISLPELNFKSICLSIKINHSTGHFGTKEGILNINMKACNLPFCLVMALLSLEFETGKFRKSQQHYFSYPDLICFHCQCATLYDLVYKLKLYRSRGATIKYGLLYFSFDAF